jgi:hypothetical protein
MKPTDAGTRYNHYRELLDLWDDGVVVLKRYPSKSQSEAEKLAQLEAATSLLRKQIDIMTGYDGSLYSSALFSLKRQIDNINPNLIEEHS